MPRYTLKTLPNPNSKMIERNSLNKTCHATLSEHFQIPIVNHRKKLLKQNMPRYTVRTLPNPNSKIIERNSLNKTCHATLSEHFQIPIVKS